jgi:NRAMP (natural resistance-associated macrophage protein)-like metal ion transporter
MNNKKSFWQKMLIFLSVMGPGIITANVDNNAGGITTYSVCGAHYGYQMLWAFVPILVALVIIQEMCSRMAVVTGKGLADLIREEFGVKVTFYAMAVLVLANIGNTLAEFAGVAAAGELLGLNRILLIPAVALFIWWIVVKGNYKSVEKVFLVACLFYFSYLISGFIVKPSWSEVGSEFIRPVFHLRNRDFIFMFIGLVGTTIAPWMQFYQQAAVVEKGVKLKDYAYNKLDVIVGSFMVNIIAFFIVVVCAATLYKNGVRVNSAKEAALALEPLAGRYCYLLFALGLLNASVFAASILPLSTAYSVCEGMGWELGVNKRLREAPHFYFLYTFILAIGAVVILWPRAPLIPIMLISQVANGVLLPFVLIFMLKLINNKRLMGTHTNSRLYNFLTVVVAVGLVLLSLAWIIAGLG